MKTLPIKLALAGLTAAAFSCNAVDLAFHTPDAGATGAATSTGCSPGATQTCYNGPPGTAGTGICKAGTQTCAMDGMGWGACLGEVLPQPVDCASGIDKHCDGMVSPCKGPLLWVERFGDASDQFAAGVASDPAGDIVVTGSFLGGIDFGGVSDNLVSAGGRDIFVAKLSASGSHVWSKRFGDPADQFGAGIAVDGVGNVLVTGNFAGNVDFGGGSMASVSPGDVFALKLGGDGSYKWSKSFGGPAGQVGNGVAADPAGNVLLVGAFYGTIDFGSATDTLTSAGAGDVFVAKLDADGNHQWSKRFGDASNQTAYGVATNKTGDVVVAGTFQGTVNFGGSDLVSAGGGDVFVAAFDAAGNHKWSKRFGDASDQIAYTVAMDAAGTVMVAGALWGSMDLGGGLEPLVSKGDADAFIVALDSAGTPLWGHCFGDAMEQIAYGLAIDTAGSALLVGTFHGVVDFGGGPLISAGQGDLFVAKLDGKGNWLWSRRAGASGSDTASAVCADGAGNAIVTGTFAQTADFGGTALMSMGGDDVYVAKYGP